MESGYTEWDFHTSTYLSEPQGNIKNWNEMESGYTEWNFHTSTRLTEPQEI